MAPFARTGCPEEAPPGALPAPGKVSPTSRRQRGRGWKPCPTRDRRIPCLAPVNSPAIHPTSPPISRRARPPSPPAPETEHALLCPATHTAPAPGRARCRPEGTPEPPPSPCRHRPHHVVENE